MQEKWLPDRRKQGISRFGDLDESRVAATHIRVRSLSQTTVGSFDLSGLQRTCGRQVQRGSVTLVLVNCMIRGVTPAITLAKTRVAPGLVLACCSPRIE